MELRSENTTKTVVQKGKLEPVEMILGTRSGNKKVTLVHNLDIYGIDMNEFAHKCQVCSESFVKSCYWQFKRITLDDGLNRSFQFSSMTVPNAEVYAFRLKIFLKDGVVR